LALATLAVPSVVLAQSSPWIQLGASAVPAYFWTDPVPHGGSLDEVRVVQPTVMAHAGALGDRLRFIGTLNLEGLTIKNGELALGDWGEGFVDRRHPHTYLHEAMFSYQQTLISGAHPVEISGSAGKGFAPFGTDDPMSRPPLRYPVNHHLAQILERAVAMLGLRAGPLLLEGGLFNGDEPERPGQWPNWSRFGDSWSARATLLAAQSLEFQGSHAQVHSPEHRPGSGTDQTKWSVSGRWDGRVRGDPVYGLIEWEHTSEAAGFFAFESVLGEGAWTIGPSRLYYRFERTDRPEEERGVRRFRSHRPILENSILGTTRWTIHTAGFGWQFTPVAKFTTFPFLEVSYGTIGSVGGGLFDPQTFYGKTSFWSFNLGARLNLGMPMHRMGRYGVAQDTAHSMEMEHSGQHMMATSADGQHD
jgi:hypothetical protein